MQKEIAEYFRVSPVAICKRLKRLLPQPEEILDKHNLTEQQKRFVIEKTKGKTNTQAVLESYEVSSMGSAKVIGSNLMAKPEIKMAINELMEHHCLTRSYRIHKLKQHIDNRDPNVSLKALDLSWKLDGSYAPEKHLNANIGINANIDIMEYKELEKREKELITELKSLGFKLEVDEDN
ncbi:MAG: terminase small subunit [Bacillota bacterium]